MGAQGWPPGWEGAAWVCPPAEPLGQGDLPGAGAGGHSCANSVADVKTAPPEAGCTQPDRTGLLRATSLPQHSPPGHWGAGTAHLLRSPGFRPPQSPPPRDPRLAAVATLPSQHRSPSPPRRPPGCSAGSARRCRPSGRTWTRWGWWWACGWGPCVRKAWVTHTENPAGPTGAAPGGVPHFAGEKRRPPTMPLSWEHPVPAITALKPFHTSLQDPPSSPRVLQSVYYQIFPGQIC